MIHEGEPENFNPRFKIVSCFVESKGDILLLQNLKEKRHGDVWIVPAGQIEEGESSLVAILRETEEETGLRLTDNDLIYLKKLFIEHAGYQFIYYIYKTVLDSRPEIKINRKEHLDYVWVSPKKSLEYELIPDEDECIKMIYGI